MTAAHVSKVRPSPNEAATRSIPAPPARMPTRYPATCATFPTPRSEGSSIRTASASTKTSCVDAKSAARNVSANHTVAAVFSGNGAYAATVAASTSWSASRIPRDRARAHGWSAAVAQRTFVCHGSWSHESAAIAVRLYPDCRSTTGRYSAAKPKGMPCAM